MIHMITWISMCKPQNKYLLTINSYAILYRIQLIIIKLIMINDRWNDDFWNHV